MAGEHGIRVDYNVRLTVRSTSPSSPASAKRRFVVLAGLVEAEGRLHGVGFAAQYCAGIVPPGSEHWERGGGERGEGGHSGHAQANTTR